ncbi:putative beta-lactamase [Mycena floridula]|nr:putative beta-lactamase [Mycena floridula]
MPTLPQLFYLALLAFSLNAQAFQNCPILGLSFPTPRALSTSSVIQNAAANLSATIEFLLQTGEALDSDSSFSIGIFSPSSSDFLFEFHHSAPSLANSTAGVKTVDADTVYRIGSVSKLVSVYTYLIELGDASWSDPVTKYIPELQNAPESDSVSSVSWADITVGDLASQLSGIGRDYGLGGDFYSPLIPPSDYTLVGLPILNASETTLCELGATCTRADFFKGIIGRSPVVAPSTTAIYSNVAYQLFGYVLESITNKPFASSTEEKVFNALNMGSSSFTVPNDTSHGVIPVGPKESNWTLDLGDGTPYGGMFSSLSDISKMGRAILNSTLLTPVQTRRWFKPHSHTASLTYSVGAPWEIQRLVLPSENRVVDVYTKNGDLGAYFSFFALIPEYNVGFAGLGAGAGGPLDIILISTLVGELFIPALEDAARAEGDTRFSGTYTAVGLNSSISLSTEPGKPGFGITSWISNGTDMMQVALVPLPFTVRLYATNLVSATSHAFRAVYEHPTNSTSSQVPFQDSCVSWGGIDSPTYGVIGIDDFVFTLGEDGSAVSLEPRFLRVSLQRNTSTGNVKRVSLTSQ